MKFLAFYLAMYMNGLALIAIGFCSGTLDGAAFMGILICYLDDTSSSSVVMGQVQAAASTINNTYL